MAACLWQGWSPDVLLQPWAGLCPAKLRLARGVRDSLALGHCLETMLCSVKLFGKTSMGAAGYVLCCQNSSVAPRFAKL